MLCRSCGAELRLGLAVAEGGLGEQLLWSVNIKKVQSKQDLTAKSVLECVFLSHIKKPTLSPADGFANHHANI